MSFFDAMLMGNYSRPRKIIIADNAAVIIIGYRTDVVYFSETIGSLIFPPKLTFTQFYVILFHFLITVAVLDCIYTFCKRDIKITIAHSLQLLQKSKY